MQRLEQIEVKLAAARARLMEGEVLFAKAQHKVLTHGRAIRPESPAERLHDLRKWLWDDLGYQGDPIPRRALDDQACAWEWRMTPEARQLAADALRDEVVDELLSR